MIINGKQIAELVLEKLQQKSNGEKSVCFIQFGNDAASAKFIGMKKRIAERLHIKADIIHEANSLSTEWAVQTIQQAVRKGYDGIVVQLPLPLHLDTKRVINAVPKELDIDVLNDASISDFMNGASKRMPPVAFAAKEIIEHHKIDLRNKRIVILGKGKLVGEPVMQYVKTMNVPVEAYDHNDSESMKMNALKNADIVITGIGQPHHVKPDMVKKGVILIDAGTSEQSGKLAGDCDPTCESIAALFSTVPGGVGPITVAGLFANMFVV